MRAFAAKPAGSVAAFHARPDLHPPTVTATVPTGAAGLAGTDPSPTIEI
jgi:hypothetical protein